MKDHLEWVEEKWPEVQTRYRVKSVLYDKMSKFQHLLLVDTYSYGKMLLLDGIVQVTEKDEFIYHEMMVHVPMLSHQAPRKVFIIGGGDGGILREVLRYKTVEKVTIVEIDPMVIQLCKEFLPDLNKGSFDDSRANLVIADGARYIKETKDSFDVIIIDSPDPIGPANILFSEEFYMNIREVMNSTSIMVRQTGSVHMQSEEQESAFGLLRGLFTYTAFYFYSVPTYVGGLFSTIFCSDRIDPLGVTNKKLQRQILKNSIDTLYYNPGIHIGAFYIPKFFEDRLK